MSQQLSEIQAKVHDCTELQSIVKTMKALSASNIVEYENAVLSSNGYLANIESAIHACIQAARLSPIQNTAAFDTKGQHSIVIIFGSDQGLVGQFNDNVAELVGLETGPQRSFLWTIGEHLHNHLTTQNMEVDCTFNTPRGVESIALLVEDILLNIDNRFGLSGIRTLDLIHNSPAGKTAYQAQRSCIFPLTLPLATVKKPCWKPNNPPQSLNNIGETYLALVKEHLFISIFRACAESLASEHASRLSAMLRAEKNIESKITNLTMVYHQSRQQQIDDELFDLIASFEVLNAQP